MAINISYGYVNKDRTIHSSSGDFTVGEKVESGVYDITFNTAFNTVPSVTANCQEDQTDRGISMHVSKLDEQQVQLVAMNTANQIPYDESFLFIAVGTVED